VSDVDDNGDEEDYLESGVLEDVHELLAEDDADAVEGDDVGHMQSGDAELAL
jgi:hypothetical protein